MSFCRRLRCCKPALIHCPAIQACAEFFRPVFLGGGHERLSAGAVVSLQQGQEACAAFEVEFTHDIVDQQDGRDAMDAGDVFRLCHLQGE